MLKKVLLAAAALTPLAPALADAPKPAALVADGIPPVPDDIPASMRAYGESRSAVAQGWNAKTGALIVSTRFGNTAQLHTVSGPLMSRRQITFEAEPVQGLPSPTGDTLLVQKDVGGNEFFQLYRFDQGRLQLLTDGKSRNEFGAWSQDGKLVGYSSTRRNGTDSDLYVMNPLDPKTDRMVAQVKGGGWAINGFSPDNRTALVQQYVSVQKSNLWLLDVRTGKMTALGDHGQSIAYGNATYAPDGTIWATSDEGSDFQRLGTLDPRSGRFTPKSPEPKWDVDSFEIARDGSYVAYVVNEKGSSKLRLLDPKTGAVRQARNLPLGVIGGLHAAPDGRLAFTMTSARFPADSFTLGPVSLEATRWTESETGGLDPKLNPEAELVEVKSFDGETVSGFLYRPNPKKFPGKRPLIFDIHGGPEGQYTPGYRGAGNYLTNELGVAVFAPNVRGSTGFGKRFVSLDNGPNKREDSVKDIGAFLDTLQKDPRIDRSRMAVTGGSYGGYMCYASAIRYGDRFKAADCIVAISNFVTFLENTQSYRRDLRRVEYGDERDPAQRAKLTEISPLTSVNRLKIPLLVVTGANDPRVPESEANQIVAAVRSNGGTAWHLVGKNEGHGFRKKENRDYESWVETMFWKKYLLAE
ncbi:dipeptidyl aminopeptidase/acylaminoacyl peptidase [Novosphingobium chloroacetimidivorans]|uniref:Dipeptidyl aminopeptidase/acylaminoacyl peptidase n=1 Tax=Novosphingobium chloroacetimidivorans TaxID=1428314 RepID=A0A7W7K6Q9_9SPHN|nr:prolyl oligopeptidase family serine peptidase [Novosphingobium chloroacetimidivorans]MBB4856935.1 dipeptidyl aminopeptidase/acylaminoacyl peptidase [Novosphingobium chloroacetimidivorans]